MIILLSIAGVLYGGATVLFALHLLGLRWATLRSARLVLVAALACHLAIIGWQCTEKIRPLSDIHGALSLSGWLLGVGYLLTTWRSRLAVIGVFLAPAALGLLASSALTPAGYAAGLGAPGARLGQLHIALSAGGVAIFGLAAAVSLLYLLQEATIKKRRAGKLLRRAPSLTALDEAGRRLILAGFPVFTLAVISGLIWMARLQLPGGFRPEYVISLFTWLVFAGLITARVTVGWRGRRAALLTLIGFVAIFGVLMVYVGRRVLGE